MSTELTEYIEGHGYRFVKEADISENAEIMMVLVPDDVDFRIAPSGLDHILIRLIKMPVRGRVICFKCKKPEWEMNCHAFVRDFLHSREGTIYIVRK